MKDEKRVRPISIYDTEGLKKEFDKIPNPEKSFSWRLIKWTDRLLEHKKWFIRWSVTVFAIFVFVPFFLVYNKIHYGAFIPK